MLGLAALIGACPYTVPEWLPDVLDHITNHLRDPAPIQVECSSWFSVWCMLCSKKCNTHGMDVKQVSVHC